MFDYWKPRGCLLTMRREYNIACDLTLIIVSLQSALALRLLGLAFPWRPSFFLVLVVLSLDVMLQVLLVYGLEAVVHG